MNKRLRELRKEILNLTLKEFGNKIGLSSSGLGDIENSRCNLTASNIKLICQTFNVNEEWLKQGLEPIFKESEENQVDELIKKYNINSDEVDIIKRLVNLDESSRNKIINLFFNIIKENIDKLDENKIIPFKQLEQPKEKVKIIARGEGITYIDKDELDEIKRNSRVLSDEDFHKYF